MAHGRPKDSTLLSYIDSLWKRLPETIRWNLDDSFRPEDISERALPGEEVQLEIGLAWYRDIWGIIVFQYFGWLFLVTGLITILVLIFVLLQGLSLWFALIPLAIMIGIIIWGFFEHLEHLQWRIVRTNARLIISIPVEHSWPLVDNIELKNLPSVVDTNWSPNPVWRVFQFFTGARDLSISLVGYRFADGKARVADAITIPDVMPQDVFELKRLVFTVTKPPPPQKVEFPSPQEVIVKRTDPPEGDV
jgi:hypothetical protein